MFGNANAVRRFGNYHRITAQTTLPAPGVGFANAAWGFKIFANPSSAATVFIVRSGGGAGPILKQLGLTRADNLGYYFWSPNPVVTDANSTLFVDITSMTNPWTVEFFSAVQPFS